MSASAPETTHRERHKRPTGRFSILMTVRKNSSGLRKHYFAVLQTVSVWGCHLGRALKFCCIKIPIGGNRQTMDPREPSKAFFKILADKYSLAAILIGTPLASPATGFARELTALILLEFCSSLSWNSSATFTNSQFGVALTKKFQEVVSQKRILVWYPRGSRRSMPCHQQLCLLCLIEFFWESFLPAPSIGHILIWEWGYWLGIEDVEIDNLSALVGYIRPEVISSLRTQESLFRLHKTTKLGQNKSGI